MPFLQMMCSMENKPINIKNKLDEGLSFKVSRFKEQIKKTHPHKHDAYYEMIFLLEGEGFHTIESEKFQVSTPDFYFLKPGQLHYWQFTSIPKGFVILFNENEFDTLRETSLPEMTRKLAGTTRLKLSTGQFPLSLLHEICQEFNRPGEYSGEIIHGLMRAIMGRLLQLGKSATDLSVQPTGYYDRFLNLLLNEIPRLRKVNEYAGLLHITPQNLNAACRKHSGKTASQLINSQLILEAKRYILHTGYTILEIADILQFTDASHFVKFFRKQEGMTPIQFRDKHFQ
jgi:AraC family transcriptional regulator, transcriptional activator of pobA